MLIDPERLSYALYKLIPDETEMIEKENPEIIMKSVKNDIETEHIRRAHLKDAVAHTKFIYWLKENIGKTEITERSASARLEEFRKEQDGIFTNQVLNQSAHTTNMERLSITVHRRKATHD